MTGAVRVNSGAAIRDIPASCSCEWRWSGHLSRYVRSVPVLACAWHSLEARRPAS